MPTLFMKPGKEWLLREKKITTIGIRASTQDCEMSIPGTHKKLEDNCVENN